MSFTTTLGVKTIHAYTAAVAIAVVFNIFGMVGTVQVLGVTLFFGFVALLDELACLSKSINRVDGRLIQVTDQLSQVNSDARDPGRDQPQPQDQNRNP